MANMIELYLEKESKKRNDRAREYANNKKPCVSCGKDKFIILYRNVVGKISGGGIYGYIDGYTKTLPVLSCTECRNEKLVATWQYESNATIFWDDMHKFYFGVENKNKDYLSKIKKIYLNNPIETYKFARRNRNYTFINEIVDWVPIQWKEAGFDFGDKKLTVEEGWWIFKRNRNITWEELKRK